MGILAKSSRQEKATLQETSKSYLTPRQKPLWPHSHSSAAEMVADAESRGFEEERQQRSNERRNGIVEPPPALIAGGERNERRRRNGVAGSPFLHAFLSGPHHQTDGSRSR